jgi:sulfotransferase
MSEKEKIVFCSGLPRSGSTLLMNILAQNPRFECTATSGAIELMKLVKNNWDKLADLRAIPTEEEKDTRRASTLRGVFFGFHAKSERPVIVDKSRTWLSEMEMAERVLGKVKVLVTVRDLRDVLASFELRFRDSKSLIQVPPEASNYSMYQTLEGRCQLLSMTDNIVGMSYNWIKDAVTRGFRDRMHFVEFDRLTSQPRKTLDGIYAFLEEEGFQHNFDHVEQVTCENDQEYLWKGLHKIRSKVEEVEPQWPKVLKGRISEAALAAYSRDAFFWKEYL